MSVNNEIHTLLGIVVEGFRAAERRLDSTAQATREEIAEAATAGQSALHTLGSIVLSDIRRIADSLEVLAQAELARGKQRLINTEKTS